MLRTRTRSTLLLAGLLLAAGLGLAGCQVIGFFRYGLTRVSSGDHGVGDPAPDARLVTAAGEGVLLSDYLLGRPLVLVFGSFT